MRNLQTATPLNFKALVCAGFAMVALAVSCVTVNVNFPESAVQNATDDYVRDLYRSKEQSKAPKASPTPGAKSSAVSFAFIASAYADQMVFNIESATTDSIKASMKARIGEIIAQKKEGSLGETSDGLVIVRNADKLAPLKKKKVEELVQDENTDRKNLYSAIVKEKKLSSDNLDKVKKSFSRSFQAESPSGTWVQSESGAWSQKP